MCGSDSLVAPRASQDRTREESRNNRSVRHPLLPDGTLLSSKLTISSGGLGHFAILFAAALGADTTALTTQADKEADAKKLGAKRVINTSEKDWQKPYAFEFDYLLNSADATHKMDIQQYLSTLNVNGELHHVGLPDGPLQQMMAQDFTVNGCKMGASHIGNRPEMLEMLKFISEKKLKPIVQTLPVSEKACAEAVQKVHDNDVRYRFCLTDYDKAFGS